MAAWWSRATYLPPPSLAWSQPEIGHWPQFPLGRLLEAHTLLLLQVTLAALRRVWSGVHVGAREPPSQPCGRTPEAGSGGH